MHVLWSCSPPPKALHALHRNTVILQDCCLLFYQKSLVVIFRGNANWQGHLLKSATTLYWRFQLLSKTRTLIFRAFLNILFFSLSENCDRKNMTKQNFNKSLHFQYFFKTWTKPASKKPWLFLHFRKPACIIKLFIYRSTALNTISTWQQCRQMTIMVTPFFCETEALKVNTALRSVFLGVKPGEPKP